MNPLISASDSRPPSTPRKRRSLATIERKLKKLLGGRQNTRRRVRAANLFAEAHRLLRRKRDAAQADQVYQAWCKESFKLDPVKAQKLRQIGETFEPSQVRVVSLGDEELHAICEAARAQHQSLLKHGSKQRLKDIRLAVTRSLTFRTDEEAQADIQQALQQAAQRRQDKAKRLQEQAAICETMRKADQFLAEQPSPPQVQEERDDDQTLGLAGILGMRRGQPGVRDREIMLCDEKGEIGDDPAREPSIRIVDSDLTRIDMEVRGSGLGAHLTAKIERRALRRDYDGTQDGQGRRRSGQGPAAPPPEVSQAQSAPAQGAVPAPRPEMHSPSQVLLEVPHPLSDDQPSDTERVAGQIVVAMDEVHALAGQICDLVEDEDDAVARRLSLEAVRGLDQFCRAARGGAGPTACCPRRPLRPSLSMRTAARRWPPWYVTRCR